MFFLVMQNLKKFKNQVEEFIFYHLKAMKINIFFGCKFYYFTLKIFLRKMMNLKMRNIAKKSIGLLIMKMIWKKKKLINHYNNNKHKFLKINHYNNNKHKFLKINNKLIIRNYYQNNLLKLF